MNPAEELAKFVVPSTATTAVFLTLVLALAAALVAGVDWASRLQRIPAPDRQRWTRRTAVGVTGWLALTAAVPASDVLLTPMLPPPALIYFAACAAAAVALAMSPIGTRLATGLPLAALIGFQAFRLPLEVVLHAWMNQGTVPVQMTWEGQNLDVITGVLAVAYLAASLRWHLPRALAQAVNGIGMLLLLNVIRVAATSAPSPIRQFHADPPLLLAFVAPYSWIASVCVAGALFGHVVAWRAMRVQQPPHGTL